MNPDWSNLIAWGVQITIVVAVGAMLPAIFRLGVSRARLWYWHVVLLVCLALPLLQPRAEPANRLSEVTFTTGQFRPATTAGAGYSIPSWSTIALAVLLGGIGLRLCWLSLGLLRLRSYRALALPLNPAEDRFGDMRGGIAPQAELLISGHISSPVTFGLRRPVVLLPERFSGLSLEERASIVCHELIHIRRHDWAIVIGEELVRSVLWFHPAIWWLLGRIQLTREQVVDQAVIAYTGDRNRYLDALLAIASLRLSADLAPAPLFLKKRHLRQRVESIVSGVPMTKRNVILPLAAALTTLPIVIGIAAWQFPLRAAPQEAIDGPGVEVQLGAARILHRSGIPYPQEAQDKKISGTVVVGLTLNEKGEVTDAVALSGPQELRKPVIQSVLNWHFSLESGSTPNPEIAVHFDASRSPVSAGSPQPAHHPATDRPRTITSIDTDSLPAALRDKVSESGVLQTGSTVASIDALRSLEASLRNVDEHLRLTGMVNDDKIKLVVQLAGSQPAARAASPVLNYNPPVANGNQPKAIRVGGNAQAANIIEKVTPKYPVEAKQARIQGMVRLTATIGADGYVKNLEVVEGVPVLADAAMEAVRQWVYKPTLLNGNPIEVITTIDVNFTLNQ